ncbi:MAG TPA: hypothetical protein PK867_02850 [Pirellulales bacterium]|nr:hypothetical protein [Pirellulales bacterium]
MAPPRLIVEEVTDPVEVERFRVRHNQFRANAAWLESNWSQLTPQAFGKFVAVAGQEAFLANSSNEAWAWARATHPEDDGPLVEYVLPPTGPRIYANRW